MDDKFIQNNMNGKSDEGNKWSASQAEFNIPPAHYYGMAGGVMPK